MNPPPNTWFIVDNQGTHIDVSDCKIVSVPDSLLETFTEGLADSARASYARWYGVPLTDYLTATFPEPPEDREGKGESTGG